MINELDIYETEKIYLYVIEKLDDLKLELKCLLPCIPDDTTTEFTRKIRKYLKNKRNIDDSVFENTICDMGASKLDRFKAYYIIFTFHHSQKNITICQKLVDNYGKDFEDYPLWSYTKSQICCWEIKNRIGLNSSMKEALSYAKKCITMYENDKNYDKNYPGIYHNYSSIVFEAYEAGDIESFQDSYPDAIKCIDNAILLNANFAKYYYTKGKLLMAYCDLSEFKEEKLYDEAEMLFEKAIDKEDSTRESYALRIVDYETALLRCKTERRLGRIDTMLKDANEKQKESMKLQQRVKDDLEEQKRTTLEVLAFFSAIISLIITNVQVVLKADMFSAIIIMFLFLGIMILSFTFLHIVILRKRNLTKGILIFIIAGAVCMLVAIIIAICYFDVNKNAYVCYLR